MQKLLLRDHLQRMLCDPGFGYFSKQVVRSLPRPLNFAQFRGEDDYKRALADLYAEGGRSWLTPVEIFNLAREEAILFKPGDKVRLSRIERDEFDELTAQVDDGSFDMTRLRQP